MSILAPLGGAALGGIVKTVGDVIDDLHTSDAERAQADLESRREDNKLLLGQQEINKTEAQHASVFVAGWRPYIGWVCGTALAAVYIPKALVMTGIWVYAAIVLVADWNGVGTLPALPEFPDLGVVDLIALTGTLLGMAGLRTKETLEGKARSAPLTQLPGLFGRKNPAEQEAP